MQQGLEEHALEEYGCLNPTPQAHTISLSVELLHLRKEKTKRKERKIQSIYTICMDKLKALAFNTQCEQHYTSKNSHKQKTSVNNRLNVKKLVILIWIKYKP